MLLISKNVILPRVLQIKYVLYITTSFDHSRRQVSELLMSTGIYFLKRFFSSLKLILPPVILVYSNYTLIIFFIYKT